jgi:hypothetical protein
MKLEVSGALFDRLAEPVQDFRFRIFVSGANFTNRAAAVMATVGDIPVRQIVIDPGGHGFVGFLDRQPKDGDRLVVRYTDSEPITTDITYHAAPNV